MTYFVELPRNLKAVLIFHNTLRLIFLEILQEPFNKRTNFQNPNRISLSSQCIELLHLYKVLDQIKITIADNLRLNYSVTLKK